MVVSHGHFPSLAPLPGGPLCLAEEEVGTFSHGLGLHGGESPWLVMSKSGPPHSLAARCLLIEHWNDTEVKPRKMVGLSNLAGHLSRDSQTLFELSFSHGVQIFGFDRAARAR